MVHIGIWERDEGILRAVRSALWAGRAPRPDLRSGRYLAEFGSLGPDLLAVSPAAGGEGRPEGRCRCRCRCLLLPGEAGPLARSIDAEYAVSYGTSPRDTLTFSSLEGERMVISLQRELVTLSGAVVEEQELAVRCPPGLAPACRLAAVGVLLLLDVSPEELMGQG